MALVASFDMSSYLQPASPPTCLVNRCSMVHSHGSASLLYTAVPAAPFAVDLHSSSTAHHALTRDDSFRSRDAPEAAGIATCESVTAAVDSGFSSDSSTDDTSSASSSTSSLTSSSSSRQRQKRVRFADDVGLDLVTVRRYDVPSALPSPVATLQSRRPPSFRRRLRLEPGFRQPWLDPAGLRCRLERDAVALESVTSLGGGMSYAGTVLVLNAAFDKRVTVRCTFDFWRSFVAVDGVYVTGNCAHGTDLFSFEVQPDVITTDPQSSARGRGRGRFEFAVRFQYRANADAEWTERWDNNDARNYMMLATACRITS